MRLRFQFTHPGGVRPLTKLQEKIQDWVSIHAPGRGATLYTLGSIYGETFQFTHPGGVRLSHELAFQPHKLFQFTHPGGVRRDVFLFQCFTGLVSIHAPGRGATRSGAHVASRRSGFNSRTREGCD